MQAKVKEELQKLQSDSSSELQKEKEVDQEAFARELLARAFIEQANLPAALEQLSSAQALMPHDRAIRISIGMCSSCAASSGWPS